MQIFIRYLQLINFYLTHGHGWAREWNIRPWSHEYQRHVWLYTHVNSHINCNLLPVDHWLLPVVWIKTPLIWIWKVCRIKMTWCSIPLLSAWKMATFPLRNCYSEKCYYNSCYNQGKLIELIHPEYSIFTLLSSNVTI